VKLKFRAFIGVYIVTGALMTVKRIAKEMDSVKLLGKVSLNY
jgi:hypothetical protein